MEFEQKLVKLRELKGPSNLRDRLEKSIESTRLACEDYPGVLQKCKDLEEWLNACSSDTEENAFSKKMMNYKVLSWNASLMTNDPHQAANRCLLCAA